jgi:hypothetical protein
MIKKYWISIQIIALLVLPVVLLVLPANFFDNKPSICLSRVFFDLECLGCGMGRGTMHLIHGEFSEAWGYNKMTFVVLPLLVYLWGKQLYRLFKGQNLY